MLEASCRRALRTSMNCLPRLVFLQNSNPVRGPIKGLAYALPRSSSDHIVAIECGIESDGGIEVFAEFFAKLAQLGDGEAVKLNTLFKSEAHSFAHFFMSGAERNALVNQIGRRGHCIEEARLCCLAHAVAIELDGG